MKPYISIFHIDDNPGDLTLANEAFRTQQGVAYEGVEQPISALARVASETIAGRPPSLILLDLNLPGFKGTDVLRLLHANRYLEKIPVVVFTSSTMEHERARCLELGATAVITKPSTFEELCALTSTIVGMIQHGESGAPLAVGPASANSASSHRSSSLSVTSTSASSRAVQEHSARR